MSIIRIILQKAQFMRKQLEIPGVLTTTGRHRVNKQCYQLSTVAHRAVNYLYYTQYLINSSDRLNVRLYYNDFHSTFIIKVKVNGLSDCYIYGFNYVRC